MFLKKALTVALVAGLSTAAIAKNKTATDEQLLANWDEAKAVSQSASSTTVRMKCFVDTPAYDHFSYNNCFNAGSARTTSAVFQIEGGPSSNYTVYWSNSACSSTSKTCILPIRWYQSVNLSATIVDKNTTPNTAYSSSATAYYEGLF